MKQKATHILFLVLTLFTSFQPVVTNATTIIENEKSSVAAEESKQDDNSETNEENSVISTGEIPNEDDTESVPSTNSMDDNEDASLLEETTSKKESKSEEVEGGTSTEGKTQTDDNNSDNVKTNPTSEKVEKLDENTKELSEEGTSKEEGKNILRREALTLRNNGTGGVTAPLSSSGSTNGYDSSETDNIIRTYDEGSMEVKLNLATLDKYKIHGSIHTPGTYNADLGYGKVARDDYNEKFKFKSSGVDEVDIDKGTFEKTIQGNSGSLSFTIGYEIFNMTNNDKIDFTISATDVSTGKTFYASTDESVTEVSDIKYYPELGLEVSAGSYIDSLLQSAPASQYVNKGENGTLMKLNLSNGISGPDGTTRVGSQELDPSKPLDVSFKVERNASMCSFKDEGGAYELLDSKYNTNVSESTNGLISKQSIIESYVSWYSEDKTADPREDDSSNVYHTGNFEVTQSGGAGNEIKFSFKDWSNTQHIADYKGIGANYFTSANMYVWVPYVQKQGSCFPINSNINFEVNNISGTSIDGTPVNIKNGEDTNTGDNIATTTVVQGGQGPDHVINLSLSKKVEAKKKFLGIFQANGLGGEISFAKGEYNAIPGTKFTAQASAISPEQHDGGFDATIKWDNRYIDFLGYVESSDLEQGLVYRTSDYVGSSLLNDIEITYGYDSNSDWKDDDEMFHDYGKSDANSKLTWSNKLDKNKNLTALNFHYDGKIYAGDSIYSQIPLKVNKATKAGMVLPVYASIKYYDAEGNAEQFVPKKSMSYTLPQYTGLQKTSGHSPYNIGGQGIFTYKADTFVDVETFNINPDSTIGDNIENIFNLDNSSMVNIQVTPYFISSETTDDATLTYQLPSGIELEDDSIIVDGQECKNDATCTYESSTGEIKEYTYDLTRNEDGETSVTIKFIDANTSEIKEESELPVISFNAFVAPELLNKKFTINAQIDSSLDMNKQSQTDVETVNVVGIKALTSIKTAPQYTETAGNKGPLKYTLAITSTMDQTENSIVYDAFPTSGIEGSKFNGSYKLTKVDLSRAPDAVRVYTTKSKEINGGSEIEEMESDTIKWERYTKGSNYEGVTGIKIDLGDMKNKRDIIKLELTPTGNKAGDVYSNIGWFRSDESGAVDTNTVNTTVIGRTVNGKAFIDSERDGVFQSDEEKLKGLNVYALNEKNEIMLRNNKEEIHSTTNENGNYRIENMPNKNFKIAIELPQDSYLLTDKNGGNNPKIDSDVSEIIELKGKKYAVTDLLSFNAVELINNLYTVSNIDAGLIVPEGTISLHKVNEDGENLQGAEFIIKDEMGEKVDTLVTEENGDAISNSLPLGTYTIEEAKAPTGYNLLENIYTVKLKTDGQVATVNGGRDIVNRLKRGTISIIKQNSNGEPLEGTEFSVTDKNGQLVDTLVTNSEGKDKSLLLPVGTYQVQEIKATNGYNTNNEIFNVTITDEGQEVFVNDGNPVINEPKSGVISVSKVDEYNNPLQGVEFEVKNQEGKVVSTLITDVNGFAQTDNLPVGKYEVQESKALDNYLVNTSIYNVEIIEDKSEVKVNNGEPIINVLKKGQVKLLKTNEDGKALAGTEFSIIDEKGVQVDKLIVDENGNAISKKIPAGEYFVQETKALPGYKLDNTRYEVKISENNQVVLVNDGKAIINQLQKSVISLNKVNDEGVALPGAIFKITNSQDDLVDTITTDVNGYAESINLPLGKYKVQEIEAPDNYILDDTVYEVELSKDEENVAVYDGKNIVNFVKRATISLEKVNEKGEALADTEFSIQDEQGNVVDTLVTDNSGRATSIKLPLGNYTVQETKAKEGYNLSNNIYEVTLNAEDENVQLLEGEPVVNVRKTGVISLEKVDQDGVALANALFEIRDTDGEVVDTLTTDVNGYAESSNLPTGSYIVKEIQAPTGYNLDQEEYSVELKENNDEVRVNNGMPIVNTQKLATIKLSKVNEKGEPLKGTEFSITDENGNEVEVIKTDREGIAISKQLPLGNYSIQETKAVDGYALDNKIYTVTLENDGEEKVVNEGQPIVNVLRKGTISLHKVDQDGKDLASARFEISDENGTVVDTLITDVNGNAESKNLPLGVYKVQETKAPEGFKLDSKSYTVSLVGDENNVQVNNGEDIVNNRSHGKISLHKVDPAGNNLANAKFEITDNQGKVIQTVTTDDKGMAISKTLEVGKYYVQEVKAPKGFVLSDKKYIVNIINDGDKVAVNGGEGIVNESIELVEPQEPIEPQDKENPSEQKVDKKMEQVKQIMETAVTYRIQIIVGIIIILIASLYYRNIKFK